MVGEAIFVGWRENACSIWRRFRLLYGRDMMVLRWSKVSLRLCQSVIGDIDRKMRVRSKKVFGG